MSNECVHRWRIEEPQGAESLGQCKLCGAARHFANYDRERSVDWCFKCHVFLGNSVHVCVERYHEQRKKRAQNG